MHAAAHEAAAGAGRHARSVGPAASMTWFSAATAPAPSSHDSAEKLAAPTTASIHTPAADGDSGMKARKRSLSSADVVRRDTSVNSLPRAVERRDRRR